MSNGLTRFLGDTPGRTALKLLVASFVVGVVMAAFNWYPVDVYYWIRDFVVTLWENGWAALGRFGTVSRTWCGRGDPDFHRPAPSQHAQIAPVSNKLSRCLEGPRCRRASALMSWL
jgi:hypothetical protein